MKFEIKDRWTGEVQFSTELPAEMTEKGYGLQLGFAVKKAVEAGANLADAYLTGAKIEDELTLVGKRPYFQIGPIGSEPRQFIGYITDKGLRLRAGCFFGTRDEFLAKLKDTHGGNKHAQEYRAALALIDEHARIWTPEVEA